MNSSYSAQIIVYSDINCPYCFTLNEWLHGLGVADRIHWVGIEHEAHFSNLDVKSSQALMTLNNEVCDVRERNPAISITVPRWRFATRLSLAAIHYAYTISYETAAELRLRLFRALWVEGKDISDESVLRDIAVQCGMPPSSWPKESIDAVVHNTARWAQIESDRIPSMKAPTGAWHLGLGTEKQVSIFIGSALFDASFDGGCEV